MGFSSASRDEKLKMLKTKSTRKTTKKLNKLAQKKKISRTIIDEFKDIKARRSKDSRQRITDIEDDWAADRHHHFNAEVEDVLPLDMLDTDIDWENSAFAGVKRRIDGNTDDESNDLETKKRKFSNILEDDHEEMLPIKLQDGTVVRPIRSKEDDELSNDSGDGTQDEKVEESLPRFEDFSSLSASQLLAKRKELLVETKGTISNSARMILSNPQDNVVKLRDLYNYCLGQALHPIVREAGQKLALASTVQVFIDIIPGYSIRTLSEEEKKQKQTKETRKLVVYEEALLRYYLKYLQLCEKLSAKLASRSRSAFMETSCFTFKLGLLAIKAMSRLLQSCSHFNYTTNILSALVRLSLSRYEEVTSEVCCAISAAFKNDISLQITLFGTRSICSLVTKRKGRVPPALLATFLHLNVKEVQAEKKSRKGRVFAQRARLKKERMSKSAKKYRKQLGKLEADLVQLDAEEAMNSKLRNATDAIKYVFQTYFSILKRLPNPKLLEPVLEGLSKFAHLLNVDFFGDLISTMEELVEMKHLRIITQIHLVNAVFAILAGDGQLLNVDPSKFYRSAYRIINTLPFEKQENRFATIELFVKTLDVMFNDRRKQVPLQRVAAFVKRLLAVATVMDDLSATAIVAVVRTLFIAHPKLVTLVDQNESEGSGDASRPDLDDPDVSNALRGDVLLELRMLMKRRYPLLKQFAQNVFHAVPSTGSMRIPAQYASLRPWNLLYEDSEWKPNDDSFNKYINGVKSLAESKNVLLSPTNIQVYIQLWLQCSTK